MNYKDGKWAKKIIELQHKDGSWGYFHSLSNPTPKQPMTTEQALRRLKILGFTLNDKPIEKAIKYLNNCLIGKMEIPDRKEKLHNWKIFTQLMFSAWIKIFGQDNKNAKIVENNWKEIINYSFAGNKYNQNDYVSKYMEIFNTTPKGGRILDFRNFYHISLVANSLDKSVEQKYFDYILNNEEGIYYIYSNQLNNIPEIFETRNTSRFIGAIEILSNYINPDCKKKLKYVVDWLKLKKNKNNEWDIGKEAKDGIYFPLSDSWRKDEDRIKDCTYRINNLLKKISNGNL